MATTKERLFLALRTLSAEIEPKLYLVSHEAKDEWRAVKGKWSSDGELREGAAVLTEGDLQAIETKVRRFRDIVCSLPSDSSSSLPSDLLSGDRSTHLTDGDGSTSGALGVADVRDRDQERRDRNSCRDRGHSSPDLRGRFRLGLDR
jgi:hypothetical protein